MLWRRANKMQSSWNEHKNHMPIALQSMWFPLPFSLHSLSFSPFPPTDAILMMGLRDVCARENLHVKSFSIGCMGPCKTGYKMAEKRKKE